MGKTFAVMILVSPEVMSRFTITMSQSMSPVIQQDVGLCYRDYRETVL